MDKRREITLKALEAVSTAFQNCLLTPPHPKKQNESADQPRCALRTAARERGAGARQTLTVLGVPQRARARALFRASPRSGFPRSPASPRKSPAGRGLLRAPSRESRERFPALRHLPEASVRESTFLGSGPTRLALSVRLRLRCHSGGLHRT